MGASEPLTLRLNDPLLRFAIANKRLIQFQYAGHSRIAEPHDYGVRNGVTRLQAYQLRGPARKSKDGVGWRDFHVAGIEDCAVLDETFPGSRGRSHVHHLEWDVLYARVD